MSISPGLQQKVVRLIEEFKVRELVDDYFADDNLWIVKGSGLLSTTYTDQDIYFQDALGRLCKTLLPMVT